ncbi:MAG: DUF2278 family protein [Nitrospirota bacterium]|nr:DUF2278 family protein [Nitrospirota bacterium]
MPLKKYGVLKGKAMNSRMGAGRSPHYQVHLISGESEFRVAINVKSQLHPSELLYLVDENFHHPLTFNLGDLDGGFTALPSKPGGQALDFIRGNLFDRQLMRALPYNVPGPDNDLNEKIDAFVQRAIDDEQSTIYAFGERWGPEPHERDKYFGFLPGNGIHDIHMNQGNVDQYVKDDGVWQDGGMLIHFPAIIDTGGNTRFPEQWVGIFLAFQSQAWHTDDQTGHRIPEAPPNETEGAGHLRIVAALVNPQKNDVGKECVTLLNTTPSPIDLSGWSIADKNKRQSTLEPTTLDPGACHIERLTGKGAQLSNKGGIITLLDPQGLKVDGVSYTQEDANRQGWTLVFR